MNPGFDPGGLAQTEADHHMKCPECGAIERLENGHGLSGGGSALLCDLSHNGAQRIDLEALAGLALGLRL
jgi:hypothetical protein